MKKILLLPRTKVFLTVVALGACSNMQQHSGASRTDAKDVNSRLQAQSELQSVMKKRIQRLEDGIQTMEDEYLQQVSQASSDTSYPEVAAVSAPPPAATATITENYNPPQTTTGTAAPAQQVIQLAAAGRAEHIALSQSSDPLPAAIAANLDMPRADRPGQCFARVFIPPVYRKIKEKVVIREASERMEVIPARYEMVEEQVLISEASESLEVIPATYKWVEEQVMVKPASTRVVEVPATYKNVSKEVMVQPEHSIWKQHIDDNNGEIMSLITVPAQYKTVSVRVIDQPATTREVEVPPEYKTVRKQVVDKPATTRTVKIAAKYKTMKVEKQIAAASKERVPVPAEYSTVTKTRKVKDGHLDWREILCDGNATRNVISQIQEALKNEGYNPGPVDGMIGQRTIRAINAYQRKHGLPVDQYLNIATIKALGVDLP